MSATATLPEQKAAPTGFTQVSASNVTNSSGNPITNATIYFQPCDMFGNWLAYSVNNSGQSMWESVSTQVTNGAFSIVLADTKLTSPTNLYYQVHIYDNISGADLLGPNYFIQPTGATWDFDNFIPNIPNLPPVVGMLVGDIFQIASLSPSGYQVTLSKAPITSLLIGFYYNGVLQLPGIHYTLSGRVVTVNFATQNGDNLYASYMATTGA